MLTLPSAAESLITSLSVAFTVPSFKRVVPLIVGAILTTGRRTVTAVLRTLGARAPGHWSDYHRLFSRAAWSLWLPGLILARAVLAWTDPHEPVLLPVDDTTCQHRGKKVYGKGCHRDAIHSTHSHVVWRWGHKWVVLSIAVAFPFTSRHWALPVLVALYRPAELNEVEKRRHKTPTQLARQLVAVLIHWFPDRRFVLLGDGGFASHDLANFCHRHRRHVTLISRFRGDANLYDPPPARRPGQNGRPRLKGRKLDKPGEVVARSAGQRATVSWYGGTDRQVELVSGTGQWYKAGQGLVPVRWVFSHDIQGTHRDEYFYSTDPTLEPAQIISWFTARWPIETTFQEARAHLGLETPRQRTEPSVLRTTPCLFGLFSLVSLIYAQHLRRHRARPAGTAWYIKQEPTFADAMAAVRRLLWEQTVFQQASHRHAFEKLPGPLRQLLLDSLTRAA
jgi:hypothetical protein